MAAGGYLDVGDPVVLLGDSGTGKTHLLIGLGVAACEQGRRVRYVSCAQLVNELVEAADERRLARLVARYGRLDLLLIDEVGYRSAEHTAPGIRADSRTEGREREGHRADWVHASPRPSPTRRMDDVDRPPHCARPGSSSACMERPKLDTACRRRPDPVASIRLSPDYGVELPVWGAEWWQLDLPPGLLDVLADWQEQFDINHQPETGWINDAAATAWADRADELAAALRNALPATIPVQVDLWPVAEPRRRRWLNRRHH